MLMRARAYQRMRMHARSSSSITAAYILDCYAYIDTQIQIHAEGNCEYVRVMGFYFIYVYIYGDTPGHIIFLQCCGLVDDDGIWEHPYTIIHDSTVAYVSKGRKVKRNVNFVMI